MTGKNIYEMSPEELTALWYNTLDNTRDKDKIERAMCEKCPHALPLEVRKKIEKSATFR